MGKHKVTEFLIYRWRYAFGYIIFGLSLAALLIVAGLFIPGGLSKAEIASALISDKLDLSLLFQLQPEQLLYLPYRLFQAACLALFGFSSFSIKLPSIILAFLSALGLLMLMNLWFRRNVAIITSIIAVTTTQFMLTAQAGHAGVSYIFWAVCILLAASVIARKSALSSIWVLVGFVFAGLSLYMPLNIYVLLALVLTAILHPHARHTLIRKAPRMVLAVGVLLFAAVISPIVIGIVHQPSLLRELLGIPTDFSNIGSNATILFNQYINFYDTSSGDVINPVYGLGTLLLIFLGLYRMFTTKYTTKSYVISFWLILLVPFIILNPSFVNITFVPAMLLLALGIDYLIWSWYRLFPHNPYARIFGLIPLSILVIGMAVANIDRYAYGYHYDSAVYKNYNFDLRVLNKTLRDDSIQRPLQLIVPQQDVSLYVTFIRHQSNIGNVNVTSDLSAALRSNQTILVAGGLHKSVPLPPDSVIVISSQANADRFYLYKNSSN